MNELKALMMKKKLTAFFVTAILIIGIAGIVHAGAVPIIGRAMVNPTVQPRRPTQLLHI